jgi:hypothetical protein
VVNGEINELQSLSVHNGPIKGTINLPPSLSVHNPTITERPSMSVKSQKQMSKTGTVQTLSMIENTGRDLNHGFDSFKFPNNTSIQDFHSIKHPLEDSFTVTSNEKNTNILNVVQENHDFESETSESMNNESVGPQFTEQNLKGVGIPNIDGKIQTGENNSVFVKRDDCNKHNPRATRSDVFLKGAISEVDSIGFAGVDSDEIVNNSCTPKGGLVPGMDDKALGMGSRSKSRVSISCIDFEKET